MTSARFEGVWKYYGDQAVLQDLTLDVADGELLVLLGPSGCGKTTSLRILAGLQLPSYGRVFIGDRDVTKVRPGARDISMVFQSYALYPNKTVRGNLAFGPNVRRENRKATAERVEQVAATLGISQLLDRRPSELSGGQRQRVALGRALIREPQLFLLDEPLSNLDAALRGQMRTELIRLHTLLNVTTVLVTHDQVEALTMGDRVAVLDQGVLRQVGDPTSLYDNPTNLFVAQFLGTPPINIVEVPNGLPLSKTHIPGLETEVDLSWLARRFVADVGNDGITLGLRPHDLYLDSDAPSRATCRTSAIIEVVEHAGAEIFASASTGVSSLSARFPRHAQLTPGDRVELCFDPTDLYAFDTASGISLLDRETPLSQTARVAGAGQSHTSL
jgi:multiple sugar transport system ATP-binding protein